MNSLIPAASCRTWYTQDTSFNISILFQVFKTCGDHNWTLQEEQILSSSEILESQEGQIIYACVHDDFWGCLFHQIFYDIMDNLPWPIHIVHHNRLGKYYNL